MKPSPAEESLYWSLPQPGSQFPPGHVFPLYEDPEEEWFEASKSVRLNQVKLMGAISLSCVWQQKGMFGTSQKKSSFMGLPFRADGKHFVLVPSDMLQLPRKGVEGSLRLVGPNSNPEGIELPTLSQSSESPEIVRVAVPADFSKTWIDSDEVRFPKEISACIAVRASSGSDSGYLDFPIDEHQLALDSEQPSRWLMNRFDGDRDVWHGSPVMSTSDGKLIGMLLVQGHQATIVNFTSQFNLN